MNKILGLIVGLVLMPLVVCAADPPYYNTSYASETLDVSENVISFTTAKIALNASYDGIPNARRAYCCVESATIRILVSSTPTATTGLSMSPGQCFEVLSPPDVARAKMIAVSGAAKVTCEYSK